MRRGGGERGEKEKRGEEERRGGEERRKGGSVLTAETETGWTVWYLSDGMFHNNC